MKEYLLTKLRTLLANIFQGKYLRTIWFIFLFPLHYLFPPPPECYHFLSRFIHDFSPVVTQCFSLITQNYI